MPALDRDADARSCASSPSGTSSTPAPAVAGDELDSRALFADSRRRVIVHQGERYCLQVTRAGKLLLTK